MTATPSATATRVALASRATIVIAGVVLAGCKTEPAAPPAPAETPAAASDPAPPAPAAPPAAPAALAEADVRAFLDAWLRAQNAGDFDAYAACYATDFRGVRRAGKAEKSFDRDGWLADRKRMFASPMKVELADQAVRIDGQRAEVELTQTWASGRFADTGRKRLVVIRQGGALAIAAEEMLSSRLLLSEDACVSALAPEQTGNGDAQDDDDSYGRAVQIVQPDTNQPRFACLVDTSSERGGEVAFGLLVPKGRGWKVVERSSFSYEHYEPEEDDTENRRASASAGISLVAISPDEQAVELSVSQQYGALEYQRSEASTDLYRVTAAGLVPLLELESRSSGNEVGSHDESRRFEVLAGTETRGYHDIRVTTTIMKQDHMSEDGLEMNTETEILRWTGDGYEPAE